MPLRQLRLLASDTHSAPSAPADSRLWHPYGVAPPRTWPSSFPAAFRFPSIVAFSGEPCLLVMSPKQDASAFVTFASGDVSGLICSRTRPFVLLAVQGVQRALLQHHLANESFFFFFSVSLLHCPSFAPTHSHWNMRVRTASASVSDGIFALGDLSRFFRRCPSESQSSRDFLAAVSI